MSNLPMSEFDYYIRQGEPSQRKKAEAWAMAIGLQDVDGLKNRYLLINPPIELQQTPASTPASTGIIPPTMTEPIQRLVWAVGEQQLSKREIMELVGLKDRSNFEEYSLTPAILSGFVRLLYPDSPKHPRQKYLLTVKGLMVYQTLKDRKCTI